MRIGKEVLLEPETKKTHYSYKVYENTRVAETFDQDRFGHETGEYFRQFQQRVIDGFLPDIRGWRILDVGGGTGRTALPLSERKAKVILADASLPMLDVAREKSWLQGIPLDLIRSDAHVLPFQDRTFDAVVSFRMLMHVVDWTRAVGEICRVSRRWVMIDFPPRCGFAGLAPFIHPIRRKLDPTYQPYRVFSMKEIGQALEKEGFYPVNVRKHLVLPFGLHRLIGSVRMTEFIETGFRRMGLTDVLGAPVTLLARRKDPA